MSKTKTILDLVRRHLPMAEDLDFLDMDTDLKDLGLDSMVAIELLLAIEQVFDITLPDEALTLSALRTPNDIGRFVPDTILTQTTLADKE